MYCKQCGNFVDENKDKFCMNCGNPRPTAVPKCRCSKCGWEPEDSKNLPKFCPECGTPFN